MLRLHTSEHIRCSSGVQQQVCLRAQAGRDGGTGRRGRATLKFAQRLVSMPRPMPSSTTKSASLAAAASAYDTYNHSPGNGHWPGASHNIAPRHSHEAYACSQGRPFRPTIAADEIERSKRDWC